MIMSNNIILSISPSNLLSDTLYYILCAFLAIMVLAGIHLMSKVETAKRGNQLSALAIFIGIVITLLQKNILPVWLIYPGMVAGLIIGLIIAKRVKMIEMPQLVAMLNGIGGAASAIVASFVLATSHDTSDTFSKSTASLAIVIGIITLAGSLIAAGKLHKVLPQRPVILPAHQLMSVLLILILVVLIVAGGFTNLLNASVLLILMIIFGSLFGVLFSVRVGGADMPITISLLNSMTGIAAAIAGFAVSDLLLVAVGGIVGASGLFLTQIMCRAMNKNLMDILLGKTAFHAKKDEEAKEEPESQIVEEETQTADPRSEEHTSEL